MRILLAGHSVEDHIFIDGKERITPGGIYYSAMGLNAFMGQNDELLLMTMIDSQSESLFSPLYGKLNNELISHTEAIPKVHLTVLEHSERCERYENLTQPMELPPDGHFKGLDGILINMITGFDLRLADLIKIRSCFSGPIFIDIHTLTRGLDENNRRHFRLIPEADKWLSAVDIVQVNDNEIYALSELKDEEAIVRKALSMGTKVFIITRGSRGYSVYWMEDGDFKHFSEPAIDIKTVNRIGCGDIFGSVFFYYFLKTGNLLKSAGLANIAAGCATAYRDINQFEKLKDDTFTRSN